MQVRALAWETGERLIASQGLKVGERMSPDTIDLERNPSVRDWLIGNCEISNLIRSMDWSTTLLGPRHSWPQSLRTAVNLILATRFPMCLLWGDNLIMIYNEGYRIIAAGKHPQALGRSTREIWSEVWEFNRSRKKSLPDVGAFFASASVGVEAIALV